MDEITTVGLDLAKRVFQVHGADAKGRVVLQKKLRREDVLSFFAKLPPCVVGMEAGASSHYWAREIRDLGHDARMIPASYVKPYVARQKNDAADAAAICEAVTRPAVRSAPIKSLAQQAARVVHRHARASIASTRFTDQRDPGPHGRVRRDRRGRSSARRTSHREDLPSSDAAARHGAGRLEHPCGSGLSH